MELPRHDNRQTNPGSGNPAEHEYRYRRQLDETLKAATATLEDLQALIAAAGFIMVANSGSFSAERRLQVGTGLSLADGGANGDLTITNTGLVGSSLQVLQDTYVDNADITTQIPLDDTIPTSSEGDEVLSQAITLANAANKVLAEVIVTGSLSSAVNSYVAALFRGTTCLNAQHATLDNTLRAVPIPLAYLDAPGSVGPHTYSVRVGPGAAITLRLNGTSGARVFGGVGKCTLTLTEIKG